MPRPIPLSSVLKVLRAQGFVFVRQKGSHARYQKAGNPARNVTIKTTCKEIPYGTFQSILLQSGLKKEDFFD
jgi:predicted RNA binding protein YcfA (HicA-like mRNA interferase family)